MTNSNVKITCPHCGKEITMADDVQEKIYQSEKLQKHINSVTQQICLIKEEIAHQKNQICIKEKKRTNAKPSNDLDCLYDALRVLQRKSECLKCEKEKLKNELMEIEEIKKDYVRL